MTFLSTNKQFEYFQRKFNSKITHSPSPPPSRLFYGHKRIQPSVLLYVSVCVLCVGGGKRFYEFYLSTPTLQCLHCALGFKSVKGKTWLQMQG